jgi:hypothetical protein
MGGSLLQKWAGGLRRGSLTFIKNGRMIENFTRGYFGEYGKINQGVKSHEIQRVDHQENRETVSGSRVETLL